MSHTHTIHLYMRAVKNGRQVVHIKSWVRRDDDQVSALSKDVEMDAKATKADLEAHGYVLLNTTLDNSNIRRDVYCKVYS